MAAVFLSFCLETKGPKIQGRHHGPYAHSERPSPMSADPTRPTRLIIGIPAHGTRTENNTTTDNAPAPCHHGGQGSAIPYALGTHSCRRFASSRGGTSLPRAERGGSDPFMIDLCKICFQKKTSISFPVSYPTTNDYCRLQTFVQRIGLDKQCIFAT